jgi:hypothetical protein
MVVGESQREQNASPKPPLAAKKLPAVVRHKSNANFKKIPKTYDEFDKMAD